MQHVLKKYKDHTGHFAALLEVEGTLSAMVGKALNDVEATLAKTAHAAAAAALDALQHHGKVEKAVSDQWSATGRHDAFGPHKDAFVAANAEAKSLSAAWMDAKVHKALAVLMAHTTYVGDPRKLKAA